MALYVNIPASSSGTVSTSAPVSGDGSAGSPITIATTADPTFDDLTVDTIKAGDGAAATPSVAFTNATTSGMYWDAGGTRIGFATGGGNRALLASNYLDLAASVELRMGQAGDTTIARNSGTGVMSIVSNYAVCFRTAAMATNATAGFLQVPSCAGAPTGVPDPIQSGQVPLIIDTTNGRLYAYYGAAWHLVALT